jgi:hypothetical protein
MVKASNKMLDGSTLKAQGLLAIIVPMLLSVTVTAQDLNQHDYTIPKDMAMGFKHVSYDYAAVEDGAPELAYEYTQIKIPLGKFDVMDQMLVPTISVDRNEFRVKNANSDEPTLYTIKSQFMFIEPQDDQWTRIIQITPSVHSDMEAVSSDSFSLMGLAIWRYQSTNQTAWTMGFGLNRLFGEYQPIPLISYQNNISNRLRLDLGFPITKAEYSFQTNLTGFASFAPVGGNWSYESSDNGKLNASYSSWVASTGIRYQVKKNIWATIEVGNSMNRLVNFNDDTGDTDADLADSSAIMFSVGFHP